MFNNCIIHNNEAINRDTVESNFRNTSSSCGDLCWVPDRFQDWLGTYPALMNVGTVFFPVTATLATIELSNGTVLYDQTDIILAYVVTMIMEDMTVHETNINEPGFNLVNSQLNFTNMNIYD